MGDEMQDLKLYFRDHSGQEWNLLCDLKEIPEFTEDDIIDQSLEESSIQTFRFDIPMELTCEIFLSKRAMRKLDNLVLYRWLAKGPVRKKESFEQSNTTYGGMALCQLKRYVLIFTARLANITRKASRRILASIVLTKDGTTIATNRSCILRRRITRNEYRS